jgi:hypothetical protein
LDLALGFVNLLVTFIVVTGSTTDLYWARLMNAGIRADTAIIREDVSHLPQMRANQEMMLEGINALLAQRALTRESEMGLTLQRFMA